MNRLIGDPSSEFSRKPKPVIGSDGDSCITRDLGNEVNDVLD